MNEETNVDIDNFYPGKDGAGIQPTNQDGFFGRDGKGLAPVDPAIVDKFEKAAYKSINDEAVKFGEAVVTVMT